MEKKINRVLCLISTNNRPTFNQILEEGTLPSWANHCANIDVVIVYGCIDNKLTRFLDATRERLRYSSKFKARLGQLIDFLGYPWLKWTPKVQVVSKDGVKFLEVRIPEILSLYRWKYLAGIRYFLENPEYDFLYHVNASCFVSEKVLLETISKLEVPAYAGSLIWDEKSQSHFISGANRIFSRDVANLIYDHRERWGLYTLEDQALGRMTTKMELTPFSLNTLNFSTIEEIMSCDIEILQKSHHFRLKSQKNTSGASGGGRNDVELFKVLSQRLNEF